MDIYTYLSIYIQISLRYIHAFMNVLALRPRGGEGVERGRQRERGNEKKDTGKGKRIKKGTGRGPISCQRNPERKRERERERESPNICIHTSM